MIVSKTDKIPNKKIVSVLGKVKTRQTTSYEKYEWKARDRMIRKAKKMGANAIINFSYRRLGLWEVYEYYRGLAGIVEDILPIQKVLSNDYCWQCGKRIKDNARYCGSCYAKQ
ncbi:unnamed protein product [marine sediment metagenome]|uniref:Zinc-ribbon domain-containing protein n=1 Tax=marine sediment metagenome TaxID=412755 RepID=X1INI4_9ZZZZ